MRGNVRKCLPILRKQIHDSGYGPIRECLVRGKTIGMSGKDRREAIQILDEEQNYGKKNGLINRLKTALIS